MHLLKKNIFVNFLYILFISINNINSLPINSTEYKNDINLKNVIFPEIDQKNTDYILGEGDKLKITFYGLSLFDNIYTINPNGNLVLPELEEFYAKGKTLKELKVSLNNKYKDYIVNPDLLIEIIEYRDLNITLRGAVNRTGLFKLPYDESSNYMPRLFDALKLGEGVTSNADLKNIIVIRDNSTTNGGGKIKANINLITFLDEGDQTQNIQLRDGDDIFVGRSKNTIIEQLNLFNKSNLSPSTVVVFVNGNVMKSGSLQIPRVQLCTKQLLPREKEI